MTPGQYQYTHTKAPSGFDASATHTVGIYGSRNSTVCNLGTNYASATFNFVPNGLRLGHVHDIIKTAICVNSTSSGRSQRACGRRPASRRPRQRTASLDRSNSESSLAKCGPKNRATLYRAPNVLGTRCTRSSWRSSSPWSVILKSLVAKVIGRQRDAQ